MSSCKDLKIIDQEEGIANVEDLLRQVMVGTRHLRLVLICTAFVHQAKGQPLM
jgi:uncharacterized membrane protein YdfJ with MMPL/SSD domain